MGLDKDYLNADPLYRRARAHGNRHDHSPFEVVGGGGWHPLVTVAVWATVFLGGVVGFVLFSSRI